MDTGRIYTGIGKGSFVCRRPDAISLAYNPIVVPVLLYE